MEIRVLQYFLAIAREQSIVRAAESLHLSQPTLSTQIHQMEKELGKHLLIRDQNIHIAILQLKMLQSHHHFPTHLPILIDRKSVV